MSDITLTDFIEEYSPDHIYRPDILEAREALWYDFDFVVSRVAHFDVGVHVMFGDKWAKRNAKYYTKHKPEQVSKTQLEFVVDEKRWRYTMERQAELERIYAAFPPSPLMETEKIEPRSRVGIEDPWEEVVNTMVIDLSEIEDCWMAGVADAWAEIRAMARMNAPEGIEKRGMWKALTTLVKRGLERAKLKKVAIASPSIPATKTLKKKGYDLERHGSMIIHHRRRR